MFLILSFVCSLCFKLCLQRWFYKVNVCVCVCVEERESGVPFFFLDAVCLSVCVCVCVCESVCINPCHVCIHYIHVFIQRL